MSNSKQLPLGTQIKNMKHSFLQVANLPLENILSTAWLKKFSGAVPHRCDAIFTPLITLRLFLLQVLNDDRSCKATVARFIIERAQNGESEVSYNSGPYCAARQRLPLNLCESAVKETAEKGKQVPHRLKWNGFHVYNVDGTTVQLEDTEENQAEFPQQKNQKPGLGFPIVRLCALISLSNGMVADYTYGPYEGKGVGESSLFNQIQGSLTKGDLLLADRYYATYAIIMLLLIAGVPIVMRSHANRIIDYRKGTRLSKRDHLMKWEKPKRVPVWMSKEDYDNLPDTLEVREFRVNGIDYITTLLDPKKFPKKELNELYKQRWNIELDFRTLKTHMGMDELSCRTPKMIKIELSMYLLAYNIIRSLIINSAEKFEKIPRNISFRGAAQLIVMSATSLIVIVSRNMPSLADTLLQAISSNPIGLRNRTPQPRARKRRPKPYPLLMTPREQAVKSLLFQHVIDR